MRCYILLGMVGGLAMFLGLVQEAVVLGSMLLAKAGVFFFMVG